MGTLNGTCGLPGEDKTHCMLLHRAGCTVRVQEVIALSIVAVLTTFVTLEARV